MVREFELPKYYKLLINIENGEVKIFSNSKHAKGRELSQNKSSSGYLRIKFNNKNYQIHSLVANYILGERPHGLCVNHIDGNKLNNRPSNLEYVTISENIKHSIRTGLHICNRPEQMGRYIDGRCKDKVKYKRNWYIQNRQKVLERVKKNYNDKQQQRIENEKKKALL